MTDDDALVLAHDLVDHGIPVVVCTPNPRWVKGGREPNDVRPP